MAQNLAVFAKKVRNLMRVMYFMLRKGVSKRKILENFNMMMVKRGKIARKVLQNIMFSHGSHRSHDPCDPLGEYEFSCSNTPYKKRHLGNQHVDMMAYNAAVVKAALEMIYCDTAASPELMNSAPAGESPCLVSGVEEDYNGRVDEAADRFISRFLSGLRRENDGAAVDLW